MMGNNDFNLEEKDIYKLLNEVKLEESEFKAMDKQITNFQKERLKKNLYNKVTGKRNLKRLKYGTVAAVTAFACLVGIGTASPTFVKNIPVLNSIIQLLYGDYNSKGEYAKYSKLVNKSVTSNGITLTINEAVADNSKLYIGYTIKSNKKINELDLQLFSLSLFRKINNKDFIMGGTSSGKYIDDYTYVGSEKTDITTANVSNVFNVALNVTNVMDIKGNWNFEFNVSKDDISNKTTVFNPNNQIDFGDRIQFVDKIEFSPLGTYISSSENYKDKSKKPSTPGDVTGIFWIVFNDKGVELISNSGTYGMTDTSKQKDFLNKWDFEALKNIPKYLTVIPYYCTPTGGGGILLDAHGNETPIPIKTITPKESGKVIDGTYPFELSQGKMGKLIIKEIKTEKDKTIVKYTAIGKAPYTQASTLFIKDENEDTIKIKERNIRKDDKNPNEYTQVFQALDPNKKYTIYTNDFANIELKEDLKFKIELKK